VTPEATTATTATTNKTTTVVFDVLEYPKQRRLKLFLSLCDTTSTYAN
jgi:hypothetical protein